MIDFEVKSTESLQRWAERLVPGQRLSISDGNWISRSGNWCLRTIGVETRHSRGFSIHLLSFINSVDDLDSYSVGAHFTLWWRDRPFQLEAVAKRNRIDSTDNENTGKRIRTQWNHPDHQWTAAHTFGRRHKEAVHQTSCDKHQHQRCTNGPPSLFCESKRLHSNSESRVQVYPNFIRPANPREQW